MTKIATLTDALLLKLSALYDIENRIVKALPKMVKHAEDANLKEAFRAHLEETRFHLRRLEQCFKTLGVKAKKIKVEGIRGIIADAEWMLKQKLPIDLRDASLIASAQYVEHYEMAGYRSAKEWAQSLGLTDVVLLLSQTLEEEMAADEKLAMIADATGNRRALRA